MPSNLQDKVMLGLWKEFGTLTPPEREWLVSVIDSLIREARARQAYRATGEHERISSWAQNATTLMS